MKTLSERLSAAVVRESAHRMLNDCQSGKTHFSFHPEHWDELVSFVADVCRDNYPDLKIPSHCRWNHFKVQGVNLAEQAYADKKFPSPQEKGRSLFDLMIVSVLLDAGAGDIWKFSYQGQSIGRSEGLALASWEMFRQGLFSIDKNSPWQVNAQALMTLTTEQLANGLQVSPSNPLVGLEGRLELLRSLGRELQRHASFSTYQRPSDLLDLFAKQTDGGKKPLPLPSVLQAVLHAFGGVWPSLLQQKDEESGELVALGDTWFYEGWDDLISFHKLSQWLTYSLVLPCETFGFDVTNVNGLTGLPEYRNGGLFLDLQVLQWRHAADATKSYKVDHSAIIEWRALTVALLDELAVSIRKKLGKTADELSLTAVLEGGSWAAGRKIAKIKRPQTMGSPVVLESTGTVF